ncbi:MAG: Unknown protein [uncultured Sulfurovum sp.]|uniref:Chromosome partition protein Smc n=1 Tax=uncultured Sulfurovum sp. TaxID=269237 RepID=A0A6S6SHJ5_9BACT|nr:MAG: Unknown protein [uncultured Sulfurovum sp.]
MKKIIFILTIFPLTLMLAFESGNIASQFNIMKQQLETNKVKLYKVQNELKDDISRQRQELTKIENGLDRVLSGLQVFKRSFDACYIDYDDSIKSFTEIRDNTIRRYPHKRQEATNMYYEDIDSTKEDLKTCLSSKGDFLAELKGLRTKLDSMKETIDTSRNSIPRLEKKLKDVNKKIMRITEEINSLEGTSE